MSSWRVTNHVNKYTFACTILTSMTLILTGLDSKVILMEIFDLHLFAARYYILLAANTIASLGAASASDWFGRPHTLVFSVVAFFFGGLTTTLTRNEVVFFLGEVLISIGVGSAKTVAPLYVFELSPDSTRGFLTSFVAAFAIVGTLIGDVIHYLKSDEQDNYYMSDEKSPTQRGALGIAAILCGFLAPCLFALPESPSWLVSRGRLSDAKQVLDKISVSQNSAESRLTDLKSEFGISQESQNDVVSRPNLGSFWQSWKEFIFHSSPLVRRALIAVVGLNFFRQATGVNFVAMFHSIILKNIGMVKEVNLLVTIAGRLINIGLVLTAGFTIDKIGRRPLLLVGVAGMIPSFVGLGFAMEVKRNWIVALVMISLSDAFYSIGLGSITWVYSLEVFPGLLRARGSGLAGGVQLVTSGIVIGVAYLAMTFYSEYYCKIIFAFASAIFVAWFYIYKLLPETLNSCHDKRNNKDHVVDSESLINKDFVKETFDENTMNRGLEKSSTFPVAPRNPLHLFTTSSMPRNEERN